MELKGKVIEILEVMTGAGSNGEWKKGGFVVETNDQYPKKVAIDLWKDKLDAFKHEVGEEITVSINIESREHNGRWFTNVQGWKFSERSEGSPEPVEAEGQDPDNLPF